MSDTWTEDDERDYLNPNGSDPAEDIEDTEPTENVIFTAPDMATFVKRTRTTNAKDYEAKVRSMLKGGLFHSLDNENLADAAVYLHHGPKLAATAGDLADKDERVARAIDMITAPDNPYVAFVFVGLGMIAQFARNHEETLQQIPPTWREARKQRKLRKQQEQDQPREEQPRVQLKLPFGRTLSFAFRFKFRKFVKLGAVIHLRSESPAELVNKVFADDKLLKALAKEGYVINRRGGE